MTYVKALIFEDALNIVKVLLNMKESAQDDASEHLYDCQMTYIDSVFEE